MRRYNQIWEKSKVMWKVRLLSVEYSDSIIGFYNFFFHVQRNLPEEVQDAFFLEAPAVGIAQQLR